MLLPKRFRARKPKSVVVVGSNEVARRRKRGPKTAEGRLAVRLNASTHGILSPEPVVLAYEKPQDWEDHRTAIIDSLVPEGGMERVLAERVALMSWRLNRVTLYEAERLQEGQEGVIEEVRQDRLRRGRMKSICEGLDPDSLRVTMKAHPLNVLEDLKMARAVYRAVCRLPDASEEDTRRVEGGYGALVLDLAARGAVKMVDHHAGRDPDEREVKTGRKHSWSVCRGFRRTFYSKMWI
jgi:hypothetical protein